MNARLAALLVVCAMLAPIAVAAPAAADGPAVTNTSAVTTPTFSGPGVYHAPDGTTYLWRGDTTNITATVHANTSSSYGVCAVLPSADTKPQACTSVHLDANQTRNVTVSVSKWPATPKNDTSASQPVVVQLTSGVNGDEVARTNATVRIVARDGNVDGDQLTNAEEAEHGTDMFSKDTDGDGLWDGEELKTHDTNPLKKDTDGDGLLDAQEVNRGTNPNVADTDGDGLDDGPEVNDYGTNPMKTDTDGDGLPDGAEVKDYASDPTVADSDGDGLNDGAEIHRYGTAPATADTDGDLLSDGTEIALGSNPTDALSPWLPLGIAGIVVGGVIASYTAGVRVNLDVREFDDREITVPVLVRNSPDPPNTQPPPSSTDTATPPSAENTGHSEQDTTDVFLTDEDRVRHLLSKGDGYLRQQELVCETGWSKSKVSRLLSRMEDDGEVTKIHIGRENIIALPGEEPPGTRSPFEE